MIICLDADEAGQTRGRTLGRLAQSAGCEVLQLLPAELDGAKDVAAYWEAHRTLPPALEELIAEERTDLDEELIAEYARCYSVNYIADSLASQYARWDAGEQTPQARKVMADWQTFAARRAIIDAERAHTPRNADTGTDDGDTGEWLDLEP